MTYSLSILPRASRELEDLPADAYPRAVEAIRKLAENPRPQNCLKLMGREG